MQESVGLHLHADFIALAFDRDALRSRRMRLAMHGAEAEKSCSPSSACAARCPNSSGRRIRTIAGGPGRTGQFGSAVVAAGTRSRAWKSVRPAHQRRDRIGQARGRAQHPAAGRAIADCHAPPASCVHAGIECAGADGRDGASATKDSAISSTACGAAFARRVGSAAASRVAACIRRRLRSAAGRDHQTRCAATARPRHGHCIAAIGDHAADCARYRPPGQVGARQFSRSCRPGPVRRRDRIPPRCLRGMPWRRTTPDPSSPAVAASASVSTSYPHPMGRDHGRRLRPRNASGCCRHRRHIRRTRQQPAATHEQPTSKGATTRAAISHGFSSTAGRRGAGGTGLCAARRLRIRVRGSAPGQLAVAECDQLLLLLLDLLQVGDARFQLWFGVAGLQVSRSVAVPVVAACRPRRRRRAGPCRLPSVAGRWRNDFKPRVGGACPIGIARCRFRILACGISARDRRRLQRWGSHLRHCPICWCTMARSAALYCDSSSDCGSRSTPPLTR